MDPIDVTAYPDSTQTIWTTDNIGPLAPPGTTYNQIYNLVPPTGDSYPTGTPTATVSATWTGGSFSGSQSVTGTPSSTSIEVAIGLVATHAGFGSDLNLTIVITVGVGNPG